MGKTSRFERFLNFVGLWFTMAVLIWAVRALGGILEAQVTWQQFWALTILSILSVIIALAAFVAGLQNLYRALKE